MNDLDEMIAEFRRTSFIAPVFELYIRKRDESIRHPGSVDRTDMEQILDYIYHHGGPVGSEIAEQLRAKL